MAYIKVDIKKLGQLESQLNRIPSVISSTAAAVRAVCDGLDWDVACESNVDSTLRRIAIDLEACKSRMQNTVCFVDSAVQQYHNVEYESNNKTYVGKASNVKSATIKSNIDVPQESEYENRQKKAKACKWVVGGLCAIGSIALIIGTGGAATPLVAGAVSAVSGAAMAATEHLADEYVEKGTLSETNLMEFGTDVVIGGVVGFATGYIGAGVGKAVTTKLSSTALRSGLCSTNTLIRAGSNAVVGSASAIVSGITSRGTEALIEGVIEKDVDLGEIVTETFDPKRIAYDAVVGGATSAFNEIRITKKDTARYEQHLKDIQDADHLTPGMDADDYAKFQAASKKQEFISKEQVRYQQHLKNIQDADHLTPGMDADDYAKFMYALEHLD